MKNSKIASAAALALLIGATPGIALSQLIPMRPQAAIEAQRSVAVPDVQAQLHEIGRRLQQTKVANFSRPVPQAEYVEAQRQAARGDYRQAAANLDRVEEQLDSIPN